MSDSEGGVVSYSYDGQDQLATETQSGTGVDPARIEFTYDAAGNMTGVYRYGSLDESSPVATTSIGYDPADRLTSIATATAGHSTISSYGYTYNADSEVTQETKGWELGGSSATDTMNYTYTDNGQLTGVTHSDSSFSDESFSYDANGNPTNSGDETGTDNELTTDGTYNYTYDADGNLITQTDIATGDETVYTYDFRNRLTEVQQIVAGVESVLATYTYDALDRRIGVSEGGATTWTVYDGTTANPIMDFDGSGSLAVRYLNGPTPAGVDAVLARDTASGGLAWYLDDALDSVGDIVDNEGDVLDHVDYSAFGDVLAESHPDAGDRFKYATMEYDSSHSLYFDQARWYLPQMNRFATQDPAGFSTGDSNLYRYAENSSTTLFDPTGLNPLLGTGEGPFFGSPKPAPPALGGGGPVGPLFGGPLGPTWFGGPNTPSGPRFGSPSPTPPPFGGGDPAGPLFGGPLGPTWFGGPNAPSSPPGFGGPYVGPISPYDVEGSRNRLRESVGSIPCPVVPGVPSMFGRGPKSELEQGKDIWEKWNGWLSGEIMLGRWKFSSKISIDVMHKRETIEGGVDGPYNPASKK